MKKAKNPFLIREKFVFFAGILIEGADAKHFQVINSSIAKDNLHVWFYSFHRNSYSENPEAYIHLINEIDATTFKLIGVHNGYGYIADKINVYYLSYAHLIYNKSNSVLKLNEANSDTFCMLGSNGIYYGIDKNAVYYNGELIKEIDPIATKITGGYVKDKNVAYYCNIKLKNVYTESLSCIGISTFAKDKTNIYCRGDLLNEVDYQSFEVLDYFEAKDKNYIFYFNDILRNVKKSDRVRKGYLKDVNIYSSVSNNL